MWNIFLNPTQVLLMLIHFHISIVYYFSISVHLLSSNYISYTHSPAHAQSCVEYQCCGLQMKFWLRNAKITCVTSAHPFLCVFFDTYGIMWLKTICGMRECLFSTENPCLIQWMDDAHIMSKYNAFCFLIIVQCIKTSFIYGALFRPHSEASIINLSWGFSVVLIITASMRFTKYK